MTSRRRRKREKSKLNENNAKDRISNEDWMRNSLYSVELIYLIYGFFRSVGFVLNQSETFYIEFTVFYSLYSVLLICHLETIIVSKCITLPRNRLPHRFDEEKKKRKWKSLFVGIVVSGSVRVHFQIVVNFVFLRSSLYSSFSIFFAQIMHNNEWGYASNKYNAEQSVSEWVSVCMYVCVCPCECCIFHHMVPLYSARVGV